MAGLYLGMLPADVEAAFQAMTPSPRTQTTQATFPYNVLGQRRETEPFLSAMHAETTAQGSRILLEVGFAPPHEGGQAVAVRRYHRQDVERIPRALYRDSLVEKYGEPDEEVEADESGTNVLNLIWRIGGGPLQCVDYPPGAWWVIRSWASCSTGTAACVTPRAAAWRTARTSSPTH